MSRPHSVRSFLALIVATLALLAPAGASAATVVNGDFENGSISGWQVVNNDPDCGSWFAYTGSATPLSGFNFFPPPQGNWGALSDQDCANTSIIYQDVALEPAWAHQLGMFVYYDSKEAIAVPTPNTLSYEIPGPNQQMRVDVIKPTASIFSVNPEDILATVFANKNGDPEAMAPTVLSADLSAFAGQTVRLRAVTVAGSFYFTGGIDSVGILSTPPSNAISRGKLTLNKKNGTAKLAVNVPGPGVLTAVAKGKKKKVKKATLTATAAGTVKVPLKPNSAGKKVLDAKGKLKARIDVTFTPTGGFPATQTYKVTLKKNLKK